MNNLLFDIILPLFSTLAFCICGLTVFDREPHIPSFFKKYFENIGIKNEKTQTIFIFSMGCILLIIFFMIFDAIIAYFTLAFPGTAPSAWIGAMALICVMFDFTLMLFLYYKGTKHKKFALKVTSALLVLFILECLFFNFKAVAFSPVNQKNLSLSFSENTTVNADGTFSLTSGTAALEFVPKQGMRVLSVKAEKSEKNPMLKVTSYIKDDNFSETWQQTDSRYVSANGERFCLDFDPYGKFRGVRVVFENIPSNLIISEFAPANVKPFKFSAVRFTFLFLLVLFIIAFKEYELYKLTYNDKRVSHRVILAVITLACTLSPLLLKSKAKDETYEKGKDYSASDIFTKTFDALEHGQVHLLAAENTELSKLEKEGNLYDNSVRGNRGISYMWDHSYKDGKYYSYFGITPIITLYYPMYFLTGKIPALDNAILFFGIFAAFFTCLALISGAKLLCKNVNFVLLCLLLPTCVAGEGVFYCLQSVSMYVLPVVCSTCFLAASLYFGFNACIDKRYKRDPHNILNYVKFGFSGLCLGLCAGARPTISVCAAVLIPLFLGILLNKERPVKEKVIKAVSFVIPLFAALLGFMSYNSARFGSPMDFGAQYQLTVSNINANSLRLYAIPDGIYHYFFHAPSLTGSFPFVSLAFNGMPNYERYRFNYLNVGIAWIPFIFVGLLLLKSSLESRYKTTGFEHITSLQKRAVIITGFAAAFFLAWADFCLAGCGTQYIFDIAPILCISSSFVLLTHSENKNCPKYRLILISCLASIIIVTLFVIGTREGIVHEKYPLLYQTAEEIIQFWH